ncbi:hypothetical protein EJ06DRAFT_494026 [Trichodelitschia bisporula]|uniref:Calcineurin-like phosphoesterase domain-containing protein n=1 Tax=Trichodelitschia bisporula TaxID=703511 RepID=A0A6G1HW89_9PEZI|nr:hypothetical protein EJ06DRAFT_494026 [Trichodelitschia bisporula]
MKRAAGTSAPQMALHRTLTFATSAWRYLNHPRHGTKTTKWHWFSLVNVLTLTWVVVLYWGERSVFTRSIAACEWERWERWPSHATPHHVALVADPQLVDPHTYPGRPWPLSTLTVRYTDLYLHRSFELLQEHLYPGTTIFLGDLFDGGREWSTGSSASPEKRYRSYDYAFWLKEYARFGRIFHQVFEAVGVTPRPHQGGKNRRLMVTLPGNHDLGFANGIQKPVRARFHAYFGEGNRVDVLGNHTFVSLDTVSLSARDDPQAGSEDLWQPTQEFLEGIQPMMAQAAAASVEDMYGLHKRPRWPHKVFDTHELASAVLPARTYPPSRLPAILLTHVPLWRDPGTPCGPLREHYPPTLGSDGKPLESDTRNAIRSDGAGYQYQNSLSEAVSRDITTSIGNLSWAFSGDDHDHCDVRHRRYPSAGAGIREITVKSISWAMGVRKPGFVMLSLWNPVGEGGEARESGETVQAHLCLLPDQLGIFLRYAQLFVLTLLALAVRAAYLTRNPQLSTLAGPDDEPVLPTSERERDADKAESSASDDSGAGVRARGSGYCLPARHGDWALDGEGGFGVALYGVPAVPEDEEKEWEKMKRKRAARRRLRGFGLWKAEMRWSLARVVLVVGGWYGWLLWRG